MAKFHHKPLGDNWCYLLLDGVWLKLRRAFGPQKVLLLVAYGIRADGRRQLLAFVRAKSESQAGWEGLLNDLYRRGLRGDPIPAERNRRRRVSRPREKPSFSTNFSQRWWSLKPA